MRPVLKEKSNYPDFLHIRIAHRPQLIRISGVLLYMETYVTSQQWQDACAVLFHPAVRFCSRDFILLVVLTPLYTSVM